MIGVGRFAVLRWMAGMRSFAVDWLPDSFLILLLCMDVCLSFRLALLPQKGTFRPSNIISLLSLLPFGCSGLVTWLFNIGRVKVRRGNR